MHCDDVLMFQGYYPHYSDTSCCPTCRTESRKFLIWFCTNCWTIEHPRLFRPICFLFKSLYMTVALYLLKSVPDTSHSILLYDKMLREENMNLRYFINAPTVDGEDFFFNLGQTCLVQSYSGGWVASFQVTRTSHTLADCLEQ